LLLKGKESCTHAVCKSDKEKGRVDICVSFKRFGRGKNIQRLLPLLVYSTSQKVLKTSLDQSVNDRNLKLYSGILQSDVYIYIYHIANIFFNDIYPSLISLYLYSLI